MFSILYARYNDVFTAHYVHPRVCNSTSIPCPCVGVWLGETLQQGGDHCLGLCELHDHEGMPHNGTSTTWGRQSYLYSIFQSIHRQYHICGHSNIVIACSKQVKSYCKLCLSLSLLPRRTAPCPTASLWTEVCCFCFSSTAACFPLCRWEKVYCSSTCHVSSTGVAASVCVHIEFVHVSSTPAYHFLIWVFTSGFIFFDFSSLILCLM